MSRKIYGMLCQTCIIHQNNRKTVVVFGATGNLGAYISVKLKEDGYNVIAVGGRKSDNGFFQSKGMTYYSVNIKKPEEFDKIQVDDVYAVAHFAGSLPSRYAYDPCDLIESITIGTLNVLEFMRKHQCKKIVFPKPLMIWLPISRS